MWIGLILNLDITWLLFIHTSLRKSNDPGTGHSSHGDSELIG